MNASKSKAMVFKRAEMEVIDFTTPCRVRVPTRTVCEINLGGERMEEVKDYKYLESLLCKHGGMEGEIRERSVNGRQIIGSLGWILKCRKVNMEVKWGLMNIMRLPTQTYASEIWTWNR